MSSTVDLRNVTKSYGELQVVHGVDLQIDPGEFVVFVGPSGSGKSTLLRMVAGLEEITGGDLLIDGGKVNHIAPYERGIAMVFQSYALYPHMTVYKNLAFGLETAKMPKEEIKRRVQETAEILQIEALLARKPRQLSGGQRQRVAIGRAIVREPKLFLFDEPLSNLDAELRVQMRVEIAKLHKRLGNTTIYVTHDQVEAMTMAHKIVVLNNGRIEQVGSPLDLYNAPSNQFVAGFIGSPKMNFLAAAASSNGVRIGDVLVPCASFETSPVTFGIRPEHLSIVAGTNRIKLGTAAVDLVESLGGQTVVYASLTDRQPLTILLEGQPAVADSVEVFFDFEKAHFFDRDGRKTLSKHLQVA
ncbi:ABC transporter ATP-binding protein [Agrobacterium tumefaciens]|uniref:sn-glycerol-3-phosphate ABC transporter ATP-binding protein UgpC n=1 Tax=Agrobacterium tumefaciens TaxID=358 RepID=A0A4D7YPM0_AGRTU|nr:sn-glycerol-3-phosphate ABC transporter ATP-binding protein UgpC [Agrobacterium tumefaciens]QCL97697.1 sn-glycerol-3-phosphate ABC transporter ATP-binding protein UgpC [Agrobacterium tumefaciens]